MFSLFMFYSMLLTVPMLAIPTSTRIFSKNETPITKMTALSFIAIEKSTTSRFMDPDC